MKKILLVAMCIATVAMLSAAGITDYSPSAVPKPDNTFRVESVGSGHYTGQRSTPTVVDTIDLSSISLYCFGLTYDWERDGLWISQFLGSYNWVYCIQTTSPCTKIDSFQTVGAVTYFLGLGYAGGDVMYAMAMDGNVYEVDITTGVVSFYRSTPWPAYGISCGFNSVDDAIYGADWGFDECGYAQPAQTGPWNTWSLSAACGASGAHGTSSPAWLFTCMEDAAAVQGYFYQHSLTAGVPNATPDSVWDFDPAQSQDLTADCTFDGQYVYILDQGDPDKIFVYDVGITVGPITWDFEDGWQGWTHTNGLVFPAAWDVQPFDIHTPCPDPGDSSMWMDSDASGGGYSDSALSPVLIPNSGMDWLKYGFYNYGGSGSYINELRAGIKYFTGGVWNVVELAYYPAGTTSGPAWDSVDVSAYVTADLIQIYFYYDDLGTWGYYAAFDNVSIDATPYVAEHDVGCSEVVSPPAGPIASGDYDVEGRIKNYGNNPETFDVTAGVWDTTTWIQIFAQTVTLTDFPIGGDS
ncbi:hypothetical protein KA005_05025, partial [bacterium]|nr:hypothetical protein [bacterium]